MYAASLKLFTVFTPSSEANMMEHILTRRRSMEKIVIEMQFERETVNTIRYAAPGTPVPNLYVHKSALADQPPKDIVVTIEAPEDHMTTLHEFLDTAVVRDPDRRLTSGQLWEAWAVHTDSDPGSDPIQGVRRQQIGRSFRERHGVPPATRARVDGRVQRVWVGWRLA